MDAKIKASLEQVLTEAENANIRRQEAAEDRKQEELTFIAKCQEIRENLITTTLKDITELVETHGYTCEFRKTEKDLEVEYEIHSKISQPHYPPASLRITVSTFERKFKIYRTALGTGEIIGSHSPEQITADLISEYIINLIKKAFVELK